jgi:hypothetical protein
MTHKIAILGAGPVAAYVYTACKSRGIIPDVYAKEVTKAPVGAFWLRWVPRNMEQQFPRESIEIIPVGNKEQYIRKQWGESAVKTKSCSFPNVMYKEYGYDPALVLPVLWRDCEIKLVESLSDEEIQKVAKSYDVVFQTFPSQKSIRELSEYVVRVPTAVYTNPIKQIENRIYYNGLMEPTVRLSVLFGKVQYEFVAGSEITEYEGATIGSFVDLHPDTPSYENASAENIFYIGRYAEWRRHMLVHEAFLKTNMILKAHYGTQIDETMAHAV